VGKTRLALEVAERVAPSYRDGAWLCDLSGVRDGAAVPDAVLDAFGVEPQPGESASRALPRFLRAKELVLVLDNCEHLLKPAARVVRGVVGACPAVRVLATSREGLGVAGERMLAVASLEVPDEADDRIDTIVACDAVRLFAERAQAVRREFVLDANNAAAVAQICQRLDGVPLAIELAAARVAMLTPNDLALRLDQRFRLLTGSERGAVERHQTLRAAIDWSYELLDDAERRLLDRLSVFAGGFTLDAAENVTGGEGIDRSQVFELLAGLVARSLVLADTGGVEARYRLLETIRQYTQERLELRGETTRVRAEHAAYYISVAEQAITGLMTEAEPRWLEVGTREVDNVRAALAWAIEAGDTDLALRAFVHDTGWGEPGTSDADFTRTVRAASTPVLHIPGVADDPRYPIVLAAAAVEAAWQSRLDDMHRYLDEAITAAARLGMDHDASLVGAESWAALVEGDLDRYRRVMHESTAWWRARGDGARLALALSSSALARALAGDEMKVAVAEVEEALSLARAARVPRLSVTVESTAAFVVADLQPGRARELMHTVLETETVGDRSPVPGMLGDVAERLGDRRLALELFVAGMEAFYWLGHAEVLGRMLRRIGLLVIRSDPETAALLIGAGTARTRAATLTERVNELHRRGIQALEAALGPDRCQELLSQGALMDENDAVAAARSAAANALSNDETTDVA
jgi:predicted ATPase